MTDPRDAFHRARCGTVSIDPADVRADDNRPDEPADSWDRMDLYDPLGAAKAAIAWRAAHDRDDAARAT